ncbi:hypothetical protein CAPTEDRAFT_181778 [Capitella teleta]|uniref:Sulfotransferase domain-containing protein n=1 Tax=Capitella teleta TaxID=283909 RepID=R7VIG9_CAPTE|nr:hypothetical protein CAPTEDRAFT_181778 [Capitella teleta]|eukprot:ELU18414.1 hypothetical protein CAPTEDRAFT_181778 [Capitella teleta]
MAEMKVGHPVHTLPGEYSAGRFIMGEKLGPQATVKALQRGEGPEYDVLIATHPRSGTARIVEIAWLLMNDIDVKKAKEVAQGGRHLFLDLCDPTFKSIFGKPLPPVKIPLAKTHLPVEAMEKHVKRNTKIIVGFRNPKDNLVSIYHFYRSNRDLGSFKGTFSEFFQLVKDKHVMYGDVFDCNLGWWSIRDRPNTMYVNFEDLTEDPVKEVRRMAEFLGKEVTDEDIIKIVEWTTFGNMREEKSTNYEAIKHILDFKISPYMRKGTVGDWKNHFTEEESKYIDEQYEKLCVPVGLKFRFEL